MEIAEPCESAAASGEKRRFWIVLTAVCVVLAIIAWPMLQGRMYNGDDLGNYFLPLKYYYANTLAQGTDADWCPYVFGGFYLQGDGQVGMYHPLVRLAYQTLPFTLAFNLEFFIRYPLLLLGTYLLLRRWQLPCDAALLGALTFAFSGYNLLHHVHLNAVEIIAHIPFLLLATDYLLRGGSARQRLWAWLAIALLTASAVLFAYPQYVMFAGFAELLYIAALRGGATPWRSALAFASAKMLGVLMGMVQLLPTWEALTLSPRDAPSADFQNAFSLHPANLIQLVSPNFFRLGFVGHGFLHEYGVFNGMMATVLVAWVLLRRRELGRWWPLARGMVVLAAVAIVLSLGRVGLLYLVQMQIPLLNVFRAPSRYILFVHFAMAILAAIAVADLVRPKPHTTAPRREPRALWLLLVLAALVGVIGIAAHLSGIGKLGKHASGPFAHIAVFGMMTVTLAAVAAVARGWRGAFVALVLVATASQGWYGLRYFWAERPPATLEELRAAAPAPPAVGDRLAVADNRVAFSNVRTVGGYAPMQQRRALKYSQPVPRLLAGVATEDAAPLPYVRLVDQTVVAPNPKESLADIDIQTTALVDEAITLPPGPVGQAELVHEQPGRLVVRTKAGVPRLLVVSESMHPGWQARLDGEVGRPMRVNGDWLGCVVPAGTHEVEFTFQPWSLCWGKRLSVLGLMLTLVGFGVGLLQTYGPPLQLGRPGQLAATLRWRRSWQVSHLP